MLRSLTIAAATMLTMAAAPAGRSAYDFTLQSIDGQPMPLAAYRGKVLLVVNTASFCGFTPQYEGLERLHTEHAANGFSVIGIPSGDFGGQEMATNGEIKQFCKTKFGIKFPLAAKASVTGPQALPFYRWAAATLGPRNVPTWNFHKYLVGRDGRLLGAFPAQVSLRDPALANAIAAAMAARG